MTHLILYASQYEEMYYLLSTLDEKKALKVFQEPQCYYKMSSCATAKINV